MSYAIYVSRMEPSLQKKLEQKYSAWLAAGHSLQQVLASLEVMEQVVKQLNPTELRVLRLLLARIGCESFDLRRLERAGEGWLTGAEAAAGVISLVHRGIVLVFRKSWGERLYVLPREGVALWQRLLLPNLPQASSIHEEDVYSAETTLERELFKAIVCCARMPLKLTKQGTLHKKQLTKLIEAISLNEAAFAPLKLRYAYDQTYPLSVAVVLHFLTSAHLLEMDEQQWTLSSLQCSQWLHAKQGEQRKQLYYQWTSIAFPAAASLQHAALLLERWPEGDWLSRQALFDWLTNHGLVCDEIESWLTQWENQWINPLVAFGWLEKKESLGYRWLTKPITADEKEEDNAQSLLVQPDFEVLVMPNASFSLCWEMECFAERVGQHPLLIYRLSRETVAHALEAGRSISELINLLTKHSMYAVPENIQQTLRKWAEPFGQARLMNAVLLQCESAQVAHTIMQLPQVSTCIEEPLTDRCLLVKLSELAALISLLKQAGYMPGVIQSSAIDDTKIGQLWPHALPQPEQNQERDDALQTGFIYTRSAVAHLNLDEQLPELSDVYPDLKDIPSMWLKEYRQYHPSTRREMIQKAIEWRALLQMRREGADFRIAPTNLLEGGGSWFVTGREQIEEQGLLMSEIRWMAEEWEEMKLILPGINEP